MKKTDGIKLTLAFTLLGAGVFYYFFEQNRKQSLLTRSAEYYESHKLPVEVKIMIAQELSAIDSMGRMLKTAAESKKLTPLIQQRVIDTTAQWAYVTFKKKQYSDEQLADAYSHFSGKHQVQLDIVHHYQRLVEQMRDGKALMVQAKVILNKAKNAAFAKGPGHH